MRSFELPLSPQPQRFVTTLNGVKYQMTVTWNFVAQVWVLDIADAVGASIVAGIPLVTSMDLLEQYGYLELAIALYAATSFNTEAPPTFTNLGLDGHLYAVTP